MVELRFLQLIKLILNVTKPHFILDIFEVKKLIFLRSSVCSTIFRGKDSFATKELEIVTWDV